MRKVKIRSCVAVWILILGLMFFKCIILFAETKENTPWSINFSDVSISEALSQLTKITGVKIFTKAPLEYKISPKLCTNQSIDQILKDILRNLNYAAISYYNEKGLDSIEILIFNRDRSESPSNLSSVKRTSTMNRSLPRSPSARQHRSRRQVTGQEKILRRDVSHKCVQEASSEMTDKEGSEAEEKDEASISSPRELNDKSTIAVSDSQVESTTDSSKEEKGLPTAQQNEDEETEPSTAPEEKGGDKE